MDRKRIGYLSGAPRVSTRPEASATGPKSHVLGIIHGFEELGWEVRRFIFGDHVPLGWVKRELDVEMAASFSKRLVADAARLAFGLYNTIRAPRHVGQVDWVYERFGAFQALGLGFQRRGIPWIVETNGIFFQEAKVDRNSLALEGLERKLELWVYRRADAIVAVSEALKNALVELGIEGEKIVVVPNGVDLSRFSGAEGGSSGGKPVIGFVGTLSQWQALDLLIEALALLKAEGREYRLLVVGDGQMRAPWEELARARGIDAEFIGRVPWEEVPGWMALFDLAYSGQIPVSQGTMYHSPLKLYEYMAAGRPVIASSWSEARSLIGEDERGYLFEPGNLQDLVRALRKARAERALWPTKGRRARALIEREHTWKARVARIVEEVGRILEMRYGTPFPARR